MSTQTWLRDVSRLLDDMGVEYAFEPQRKHIRVHLRGNQRSGCVIISVSPSDHRALANVKRDVKRKLGLVSRAQGA